ncbi:hypothetical protein PAXRUDRAFT_151518, partial [Paxillus rubicundulus Ve08.2h10]
IDIPAAGELDDQVGEMAWTVGKLKDSVILAVNLGEVSIVHLEGNRVLGLYTPEWT